jgi:hypothetical protein
MLPELNLPIGFVGKDGFYWWVGQVESKNDPKNSNRYKVRIVGHHVMSCDAVSVDDLPWAVVMLPVTSPAREGNSDFTSAKLEKGDWVIGFFMDGSRGNNPVILGSFQKVTDSVENNKFSPNSYGDSCLAFKRSFPDTNPYVAMPSDGKRTTSPTASDDPSKRPQTGLPASPVVEGSGGVNSLTNPSGRFMCVGIADAGCKNPKKSDSEFKRVLTEFFGNVSNSGGQVGTQMLSGITGTLVDYGNAANGYVTRIFGIARSYVGAAKAKLYALIKKGISEVLKFCLGIPTPDKSKSSANQPRSSSKTGILGKVTTVLNEILENINCSIADLEDAIFNFLLNLIFGLLKDVISAATCVVEAIISKILQELENFLTSVISSILGPLQSILGIIASPLNILSKALKYIFDLFGIKCSGVDNECRETEQTQYCTGKQKKKPGEDDFAVLDALIANISKDGVADLQSSCQTATTIPCPELTTAYVTGGTPSGNNSGSPAAPTPIPPVNPFSPSAFFPPVTPPPTAVPVLPTPPSQVFVSSYSVSTITLIGSTSHSFFLSGALGKTSTSTTTINIKSGISNKSSFVPSPTTSTLLGDIEPNYPTLSYSLTADKTEVKPGEAITFTLSLISGSIEDGTIFDYLIFGSIQNSDFFGDALVGTMVMNDGIAIKTIQAANKFSFTDSKSISFIAIQSGSSIASVDFLMINPVADAPTQGQLTFVPPSLCSVEVDPDGKIISIDVCDRGDPYSRKPIINIVGEGVGASATAILDEDGYLVKVKIERPGTGYVPNRVNNNCVVNDFVIIRPGFGYTSVPIILIDGEPNIVRGIISEDGFLSSVEIINKTKTYDTFPTVTIIGGGGSGAKAIPNFGCLDDSSYTEYVSSVAPSGVDSVIDCP